MVRVQQVPERDSRTGNGRNGRHRYPVLQRNGRNNENPEKCTSRHGAPVPFSSSLGERNAVVQRW